MLSVKRTLSALLASLMLASTLAACSSTPSDDTSDTDTTAAEETTVGETKNPNEDNLPERDFKGEEFTFLVRKELGYEFEAEDDGDVVNAAVYSRNLTLSERFKVNFKYVQQPGIWTYKDTYSELITSTTLAGDDAFDIITGQSNIVLPLAVQHVYHDLANAEHIDFSKPYWKEGYHSNATVNGRLYSLMGDYAVSTIADSNVVVFNMKLFDNNKIEYPYQLVKDGKWTLDTFIELSAKFSRDVDGDGKMTAADQFGYTTYNNGLNPFIYSTGCTIFDTDDSGKRVLNFPDEKEVNAFDRIFDFCATSVFANLDGAEIKAGIGGANSSERWANAFKMNHSAFTSGRLKEVEGLRDMESDFGILPYPKYDENQEDYITSVLRTVTVASLPITVKEPEKCTFLLEAMASYGFINIIPAYYEFALKGKVARDALTAEMLDIVATTTYFAFSDVFYAELGASDMLTSYILSGRKGLVSFFEAKKGTIEQKLADLLKAYAE